VVLYYATRGYSLKRLSYEEDAKKQLEKAIEIKPKLISDYINLGLSYFDLGRVEEAISCYDKILRIDPSNLIALYNKRNAIFSFKKY
jgi:tetratricopeptide (TPR) repeat protein